MKNYSTIILLLVIVLSIKVALAEDDRTWIDNTGVHRMRGKYISCINEKVTILLTTGKEVEIPLKKLSVADQQYVNDVVAKQKQEENPFKEKTEPSPFQMKEGTGGVEKKSEVAPTAPIATEPVISDLELVVDKKLLKANPSSARSVSPLTTDTWEVELETIDQSLDKKTARAVSLPNSRNFHESHNGSAFNPKAGKLALSFGWGFATDTPSTMIALVDVKNGKPNGYAEAPGVFSVLALHENGKQVIVNAEDKRGAWGRPVLQLWTLTQTGIETDIDWTPSIDKSGKAVGVKQACFLTAEELAVQDDEGTIIIWNMVQGKALWGMQSTRGSCIGLSPTGRYMGFVNNKTLFIYDVNRKELVARTNVKHDYNSIVRFSPSGKNLIVISGKNIEIINMKDGSLINEMELSVYGTESSVFVDDDYLLLSGQHLINLQQKMAMWTYSGGSDKFSPVVLQSKVWFTTGGRNESRYLVPLILPHKEAIQALDKTLNDSSFRIIGPKEHVKIDLSGIPDKSKHQEIMDAFFEKLDANGVIVDKGAKSTIRAIVTGPEQKTTKFRNFSDPYGTQGTDITYNVYHLSVSLEQNGESYWSDKTVCGPSHMITLNPGETLEQAVRRSEGIDYSFFKRIKFPKYVVKTTTKSQTLGSSKITAEGLK